MHAYFDGLILRLLKSTCFHVIKRSNASYQLVVSAPGEQDQYLLFHYLPTFKLSRRSLQRIHDDLTWNIILNVGGVHMFLLTLSSSWTSFAMSSSASAGTSSWTTLWFNYSGLFCLAITWYRHWFPLLERVKQGSSNVNDFEWNGVVHSPLSLQKTNYAAMSPCIPPLVLSLPSVSSV